MPLNPIQLDDRSFEQLFEEARARIPVHTPEWTNFRTAPLWGLGQRLFFLHDGRTSDLLQAIEAHSSPRFDCTISQSFQRFEAVNDLFQPSQQSFVCGSEANKVIDNFNGLSKNQKQDILNFLRSL